MASNTIFAVANVDGGIVATVINNPKYFITVITANDAELDRVFFGSAEHAIQFAEAAAL